MNDCISSSKEIQKDACDEIEYVEIKHPFGFIYITTNLINGKRVFLKALFFKKLMKKDFKVLKFQYLKKILVIL